MVMVKFNKDYRDVELERLVEANEPLEMTVKRADQVVRNIKAQTDKFPEYKDFNYERVDEEKKEEENQEEQENEEKEEKDKGE